MKKLPFLFLGLLVTTFFLSSCTILKKTPFSQKLTQEDIKNKALDLCNDTEQKTVFLCGDIIKVTTPLLTNGINYYKPDGSQINCPLVSPNAMTEECKDFFIRQDCQEICQPPIKPKEREPDLIRETIKELSKETDLAYFSIVDGKLFWKSGDSSLFLLAKQVTDNEVSKDQLSRLPLVFKDFGFEPDNLNSFSDDLGSSLGYKKLIPQKEDYLVCKTFHGLVKLQESQDPSQIKTQNQEGIQIKCAILEE